MGWIMVIADLHGRTPLIRPDSYLVLLAGDLLPDRDQRVYMDGPLRRWLLAMPCPVIAVPGNHDRRIAQGDYPSDLNWLLMDEPGVALIAGLRIGGLPLVLGPHQHFGGTEADYEAALERIGHDVDVILTHGPPLGIMDRPGSDDHCGSLALRWFCYKNRPCLVCFGHVHERRGSKRLDGTYYVNATLGSGCGRNGHPVPAPHSAWGLADNSWRGRPEPSLVLG